MATFGRTRRAQGGGNAFVRPLAFLLTVSLALLLLRDTAAVRGVSIFATEFLVPAERILAIDRRDREPPERQQGPPRPGRPPRARERPAPRAGLPGPAGGAARGRREGAPIQDGGRPRHRARPLR